MYYNSEGRVLFYKYISQFENFYEISNNLHIILDAIFTRVLLKERVIIDSLSSLLLLKIFLTLQKNDWTKRWMTFNESNFNTSPSSVLSHFH